MGSYLPLYKYNKVSLLFILILTAGLTTHLVSKQKQSLVQSNVMTDFS